ncbi:heat shock 70 kDa protein 18-like [Silene latifolia]|uniref:heat shock 70 kDa protein 18-like n=1 Tax=Silene latifolia TaxID=37657 RepID=UPI003D786AE2
MAKKGENNWPAIGIDLGTTYSCVGIWRPKQGRVEIITNDLGNRTTPSWVAFNQHERLIGEAAVNQVTVNASNTIFDAKRLIGKKFSDKSVQNDMKVWPFKVIATSDSDYGKKPLIVVTYKGEEKQFSPEEISSMILCKMKDMAEVYLGCEVKHAVVTVPAYFNNAQRQATKDAGTIAGLNVLRIINEPTAAALAYGLDEKVQSANSTTKNVLVFDLGGGTFDVSLVTIGNDALEVKAVNGDTHLGGRDLDNRMVKHFIAEFQRKHNKDLNGNPRAISRLRAACEKAKRLLSSTFETVIDIDCLFDGIDFSSTITRARFEKMNMDLLSDCLISVQLCLWDAKMEKSDVHEVVLVGGSTRIPKVQQLLQEFFEGKELCKSINPDEAIAYGAAFHAASLSGLSMAKNSVIVDVTPLSLGIAIRLSGEFSIIVPRNTTLPTNKVVTGYETLYDNQTRANIAVYEGEETIAVYNNFLGGFQLHNIPPAPKGVQKLDVCFNIDLDGILTVSAQLCGSYNKGQITITNHSGRLQKKEIEKMKFDAKKYKDEEEERKKASKAKNRLETYVLESKERLRRFGMKIGRKEKRKLGDVIEQATQWLEWNHLLFDTTKIEDKMKEIESICRPIFENMHRGNAAVFGGGSNTSIKIEVVELD